MGAIPIHPAIQRYTESAKDKKCRKKETKTSESFSFEPKLKTKKKRGAIDMRVSCSESALLSPRFPSIYCHYMFFTFPLSLSLSCSLIEWNFFSVHFCLRNHRFVCLPHLLCACVPMEEVARKFACVNSVLQAKCAYVSLANNGVLWKSVVAQLKLFKLHGVSETRDRK